MQEADAVGAAAPDEHQPEGADHRRTPAQPAIIADPRQRQQTKLLPGDGPNPHLPAWTAFSAPTALEDWITTWNRNAKPFAWTKSADQIIDTIGHYCSRISNSAH